MTGALVAFAVGFALAIIIGWFAAVVGLGRENGFYPTLLMVIAGYYVLFAALVADSTAMALELAGFSVFCTVAVVGFRKWTCVVVAGLFAHGLFDALHGPLFANPGAPGWWPAFCSGFDLTLATWILGFPAIQKNRTCETEANTVLLAKICGSCSAQGQRRRRRD
jgi:hypothetical protein